MSISEIRRREIFLGVDFSGAARAGKAIWIARLERRGDELALTDLRSAAELTGGGVERDRALEALREHIAEASDAIVGMDFPFSLPRALVDAPDWAAFAAGFADRYADPDVFRNRLTRRAQGREWKRRTDVETKTPMSPYNLRLYRQTYRGIRDLLAPLVEQDRARCAPMQRIRSGRPVVVETCPASFLKRASMIGTYKGRSKAAHARRRTIIRSLQRDHSLRIVGRIQKRVMIENQGGDALDAVIAGLAVGRAAGRSPQDFAAPAGHDYRIEARVII